MNISGFGFDTVSGHEGQPSLHYPGAPNGAASSSASEPDPRPDAALMREASRAIERILASRDLHLRFSVERPERGPDRIVIELVSGSGAVLRRIPPETLLTIAAGMEELAGLVVDRQAV